jgi:hypothetical protein
MQCRVTTESLPNIIHNNHVGNPFTSKSFKFVAKKWKLRKKYYKRKLYSNVFSKEKLKCTQKEPSHKYRISFTFLMCVCVCVCVCKENKRNIYICYNLP